MNQKIDTTEPIQSYRNSIIEENRKPGSTDGQLTRVRLDHQNGYRSPWIEEYCSQQSVVAGQQLKIMVSTDPLSLFKLEFFRTGYYVSAGARLVKTGGGFAGKNTIYARAGGAAVDRVQLRTICGDYCSRALGSGVYLGRLTTISAFDGFDYWQSHVIFIMRNRWPVDILFQCSDNTWQAYNRGLDNYSLYTHSKGTLVPRVQANATSEKVKWKTLVETMRFLGRNHICVYL